MDKNHISALEQVSVGNATSPARIAQARLPAAYSAPLAHRLFRHRYNRAQFDLGSKDVVGIFVWENEGGAAAVDALAGDGVP